HNRKSVGQIEPIGDGVVAADFEELDFDYHLGARRSQVFEHEARGDDLGDAVAQDHAVVLCVEGDLLNGEGLLHGGDDGVEILRIGGFGEVQIFSFFVRTKVCLFHSYSVAVWSTLPMVIFIPLGMILYRVMESEMYVIP